MRTPIPPRDQVVLSPTVWRDSNPHASCEATGFTSRARLPVSPQRNGYLNGAGLGSRTRHLTLTKGAYSLVYLTSRSCLHLPGFEPAVPGGLKATGDAAAFRAERVCRSATGNRVPGQWLPTRQFCFICSPAPCGTLTHRLGQPRYQGVASLPYGYWTKHRVEGAI